MVLFPTTIKQFKVMNRMKEIQPKLKEIQDKYKDKPEEYQKRTMELYQKEKVNPFGSCLPMIIQMTILVIFYNFLSNPSFVAHNLKDAAFFGLVLKQKQYWSLAILSAVTTFLQQKLMTPATATDTSAQQQQMQTMLYIMPLMLGWFTYQVNAAIGIYWVTSNLIGIIQQYVINEYFLVKQHIQEKNKE
jgi:YidC/Oxa1 family membrane protein insertase